MSNKRTLVIGLLIGFLVAAVIGLTVALVLVAGDDDKSDGGTTTEEEATDRSDDAGESEEATDSDADEDSTDTESRPVSYPTPRAAARAYARSKLDIPRPSDLTVNFSPSDSSYGIVTFFDGDTPVAVWVRQQGAGGQGWVALGGNTTLSRAPEGHGIPDDLAVPFSD